MRTFLFSAIIPETKKSMRDPLMSKQPKIFLEKFPQFTFFLWRYLGSEKRLMVAKRPDFWCRFTCLKKCFSLRQILV